MATAVALVAALLLADARAGAFVRRGADDDFDARAAPESPALHGVEGPPRELQTTTTSSTSAGSGSAGAAPTPSRTKKPLITIAYDPSEGTYQNVGTVAPEVEQTFFGLFKTKNVYRYAGMGIPVAFLLYKLLMACWFCTTGRRKFAREDREHEQKMLIEREEMERATAVAAAQAQALAAKEAELAAMPPVAKGGNPGGARGSLSKDSRAFAKANMTSNFWVEEELQAWRLDFQQLKLNKCLTTTPHQNRHPGGRRSTGPAAGEVWLATYYANDAENNQRMVALKWISPKLANTEVQQEKLKEEIKRQAKLSHPNVATFIGIAWSPDTNLVAVTEYMPRGDLRQWLHRTASKEAGRWTPAKVKMLLDVTNALVYLHSFQPQLIHGNCNSRNVLLNERMEAKLSDFGAPKDYLSEREINAYKEVGSGRWISPEALIGREGAEHVSDAMDVYSLGILMVEMDTHQLPFADLMQADRSQLPEIDVLQLISNGALTPTLSNTCHPKIQNLVLACTAYDPQKRPSSREISRVLQDVHMEISGRS